MVEPPRSGLTNTSAFNFSTRAMMLRPSVVKETVLPLYPHSLDWLRCIQRYFTGRPFWLALEQILEIERDRKRISHYVYPA